MEQMIITIHPQKLDYALLCDLDERGLLCMLKPTKEITANPCKDSVSTLYSSSRQSGSHKLICVRKAQTDIRLTVHNENEEVIFLSNEATARPLYLILGLCPRSQFEEKVRMKELSSNDLVALEVDYSNIKTAIFTVPPVTPHCEITILGTDPAPIFYVTEPTDIQMSYVDVGPYVFKLA
jgi:hypothetical protein